MTRRAWQRDPLVYAGAIFGAASMAYVLFAGRYVPYIDWSGHVGKIAVLAHGDQTGADAYFTRSLAPTPYLSYYAVSAFWALFISTEAAAKLSVVLATGLLVLGAAALAEAAGRSPRLGLIAPLAMFGTNLGWGFSSFLFAMPGALFAMAGLEKLLAALDPGSAWPLSPAARRALISAAAWMAYVYLGHALLFLPVALALGVRVLCFVAARFRARRTAIAAVLTSAAVMLPSVLLMTPVLWAFLFEPKPPPSAAQKSFVFRTLSEHLAGLSGDLIDRGGSGHLLTLQLWGALFVLYLLASIWRAEPETRRSYGLEIFAGSMLALFLFGPYSAQWPFPSWHVYPRYGSLAVLLVALLPRVDLSGKIGALGASLAFGLLAHNAALNAEHVRDFSANAVRFDPVRRAIPPRARVLALTVVGGGDFVNLHPSLSSLYRYILCDGAAYSPYMFEERFHPVRYRSDVTQPRSPFWTSPDSYDPRVHGVDYDYLVLRGQGLIERTRAAGLHEEMANLDGWVLFRTKAPPPWPNGSR